MANTTGRRTLLRFVRVLFIVAIVAGVGWYLWRNGAVMVASAASLGPTPFALSLVAGIAYWLTLAWLWSLLQARLGGGLGIFPGIRIWAVSTVARYIPGNVWHLAGRTALAAEAGGSAVVTLTASAYEQVFTLAGALLAAGIVLPLVGGITYLPAALALPASLLVMHPAVQRMVVHRAARWANAPVPETLRVSTIGLFVALYALPNIAAGLALAVLGVGILPAIGAFAFAWSVGYVSFLTPSGLGVREVVLAGILLALGVGVDGGALALAHRVVLTVAELLVAVFAGLIRLPEVPSAFVKK